MGSNFMRARSFRFLVHSVPGQRYRNGCPHDPSVTKTSVTPSRAAVARPEPGASGAGVRVRLRDARRGRPGPAGRGPTVT
eukprot:3447232-Rhodomonas_salina.1